MQKKILPVLISAVIITAAADAQIKKGAILLGGQLGFSIQKTQTQNFPDTKNSGINISPAFGKAVKDNLVTGVDIFIGYNKYQNIYSSDRQTQNDYGLGFFVRKYKELGKGFYLFGQARAGGYYNSRDYTSTQVPGSSNTMKGYSVQLAVYPGLSYAISKKFQLETGFNNLAYLQFDHSKAIHAGNTSPSSISNGFSLGTSLSNFSGLTIGFRFLLN